jgi:hypothetical protein
VAKIKPLKPKTFLLIAGAASGEFVQRKMNYGSLWPGMLHLGCSPTGPMV